MQYYFFHLMSWPFLPPSFADEHDSAWVWVPNSLLRPGKRTRPSRHFRKDHARLGAARSS